MNVPDDVFNVDGLITYRGDLRHHLCANGVENELRVNEQGNTEQEVIAVIDAYGDCDEDDEVALDCQVALTKAIHEHASALGEVLGVTLRQLTKPLSI